MNENKFLLFRVDEDKYLIDIQKVHSLIQKEIEDIREIPNAPNFVAGMSSLRDKAILVIDARKMFGKKTFLTEKYTIVMLKKNDNTDCGIIVDEVSSVMQIEDSDIQSKDSSLLSTSMSDGVVLLNNEIYLLIDPSKIINDNIEKFLESQRQMHN